MFDVDIALILKLDYCKIKNNMTILSLQHGLQNLSVTYHLKQTLFKYNVLDYWQIICFNNKNTFSFLLYKKLQSFTEIINVKKQQLFKNFIVILTFCYDKFNNKKIFNFLWVLFQQLVVTNDDKLIKIYAFFLFHSLALQGLQFNFTSCTNCNNNSFYTVNYLLGGMLCKPCSSKLPSVNIDLITFKIIYQLQYFEYQDFNKWEVSRSELEKIIAILELCCHNYFYKTMFFNYQK